MSTQESLGSRLRRLRLAAGLSQIDVAGGALSAGYVSLIEAGRRQPTAAALDTLAARLGTTGSYLLTGVDARPEHEVLLQLAEAEMALRNGDPHLALSEFTALAGSLDPAAERSSWRRAVSGLARSSERLGDLKTATRNLEALRSDSGPGDTDPTWVAVLVDLVRCYRESGDRNLSERIAEEALAAFDRLGNPGGPEEITLANTLIATYFETGDWLRASNLADVTLARAEASGDLNARATSYWTASQLAQVGGEPGLALDYSRRAMALFAEAEKDRNADAVAIHRAWILLAQDADNADSVLELLQSVQQRLEAVGDELPLAYCRLEVARAHLHLGDADEARVLSDLASETFQVAGNTDGVVSALTVRARADLQLGNRDQALAGLDYAVQQLRSERSGRAQAELWVDVATTYQSLDEFPAALEAYAAATRSAGVLTQPSPRVRLDARP